MDLISSPLDVEPLFLLVIVVHRIKRLTALAGYSVGKSVILIGQGLQFQSPISQ